MNGLREKLLQILQVDVPLIQGGMTWVSRHELAAAVSEAGGLGVIGAGGMDARELREEIQLMKGLTDRSFGVNVPLINVKPGSGKDGPTTLMEATLEEGVPVVITAAGSPSVWTHRIHETGAAVLHVVPSREFAIKCEDAGVDVIVAEGLDAGGHVSVGGPSTASLIPQVVESVLIPVVAAGGIADARGVADAMALGAHGVQVGTRFICTLECNAHEAFKRALLDAGSDGTGVYSIQRHASRALRTPAVQTMIDMDESGATSEEVLVFRGRDRAYQGCVLGNIEDGILPAGTGVGLVQEVMPAGEVVRELARGLAQLQ